MLNTSNLKPSQMHQSIHIKFDFILTKTITSEGVKKLKQKITSFLLIKFDSTKLEKFRKKIKSHLGNSC